MVTLWLLPFVVILLYSHLLKQAYAQFLQDYQWQYIGNPPANQFIAWPFWRPDSNSVYQKGITLVPEAVFLEYNCYYMRDICVNAGNFLRSDRGSARSFPNVFGYDLNTQRKNRRRNQACPNFRRGDPRNWDATHPCPDSFQRRPMRHDGQWPYTALETDPRYINNVVNKILSRKNTQGNLIENSYIRYSCDEFPAAAWIEGGNDATTPGSTLNHGNAETRCAAFSCNRGVKAEQQWQAIAHQNLRNVLVQAVQRRRAATGEFSWFNRDNSFIMFGLRRMNAIDGVAARIYTYSDPLGTQQTDERDIPQNKRSYDTHEYLRWLDSVSLADLTASESVTAHHIYANDTSHYVSGTMHMPNLFKFGAADWDTPSPFDASNATDIWDDEEYDDDDYGEYDNEVEGKASTESNYAGDLDTRYKDQPQRVSANIRRAPLDTASFATQLANAKSIVDEALRQAAELNAQRYAHPLRNVYSLDPRTSGGQHSNLRARAANLSSPVPQLLEITDEIADAAALVAELDAANSNSNLTKRAAAPTGSYWMQHIARKGTISWGNDAKYVVFRNVVDYGAIGDGVTDDTKAIKKAMTDGNRCGAKCNGSTTKNAIIYFPPGKYLVSSTIPMPFGTQVIGDANNRPTIIASSTFVGLGVLSADEYTGGPKGPDGSDPQYYINTANFYRQVRNLRIDITQTKNSQGISCIHWQVGQATSLQNLELIAALGTKQKGIFAENGSGGVMSDITFRGGEFGLYGGQQQFTTQRMVFDGCATGVQLIWDWSWTWKSITMKNVGVGFRLLPENAGSGNIGSAAVMDSSFTNVNVAILIAPPNSQPGSGSTGLVLENIALSGVAKVVADTSGKTLLAPSAKIDFWTLGTAYTPKSAWSSGGRFGAYQRQQSLIDASGNYFERPKPQYENHGAGDFSHIKDFGAKGDGVTDDTAAFQLALYACQGKILFIDAGSYILTSTVLIPSGSKLVGETWSQLVASGSYFSDASNPKVMLKVGNAGDEGNVEMQDLLFTTRGPTAGLIMVEWNIKASSPGSAALWDCHARVGGATGSQLTPKECPPSTTSTDQGCSAASLMMHITSGASGYFENMWLWVADHMIDDPDLNSATNDMVQTSVYVARGLLIESQSATWLYGTASEHSVMYQYNFNGAKNIFAGLIQTESPYYQPNPKPPAPFANVVGKMAGDPDYKCAANDEFSGCDESWAVIIRRSANIVVGGAGLYSWFSNYAQTCIDSQTCQKAMMLLQNNNAGVRFHNLVTIGAKYMAIEDGKPIKALDNLNVRAHPFWSLISVLDFAGNGKSIDNAIWIDPAIWDMDEPQFTCSPPCVVKIPPWTKATSTVNYPLITVSKDSWTSTITRPPLTIAEVLFQDVTLTSNVNLKLHRRQPFSPFFPTPASVPYYSPATYVGPDGMSSTVTPTDKFPDQPASIGPNAPPPPTGSWPQRAIRPFVGAVYTPIVAHCGFDAWECLPGPWSYGGMGAPPGIDPLDGDGDEPFIPCPEISRSSTTTTPRRTTPIVTTLEPTPSPAPWSNFLKCFNRGLAADHFRLDNAIDTLCGGFADGHIQVGPFFNRYRSTFNQGSDLIRLAVDMTIEVFDKCQWKPTVDECKRYMEVPLNSCNCGGVDGKQGGVITNNCIRIMVDPNNADFGP